MSGRRVALVLVFLLVPLGTAGDATVVQRHIARLLASPVPIASDEAAFHVDVPAGVVVTVDARSAPTSVFQLHFQRDGGADEGAPNPSWAQSALLGPGAWSVVVDPVAGAEVKIDVTFGGYVSDVGGAPASFGFYDISIDRGCVSLIPEVCLP